MRTLIGVVVLVMAQVAVAKPLPAGMKITNKDQKMFVTWKGVTVSLVAPETALAQQFNEFKGARLSDDGKTIVLDVGTCSGGDDADHPSYEVDLATVEARVENALGMQLHLKKKYTDAIPHFAAAAKADPNTPVYATNLLSAQSMAKLLDDADKTLAAYGPGHAPWFAWRLAVDPELVNVKDRAAAKALLAPRPSKLTLKMLGDSIATNAKGWIAIEEWVFRGGPGAPQGHSIVFYDASGNQLLELPVMALDDACDEPGDRGEMPPMTPCTKANRAHTAQHTREVELVLQALGFEKVQMVWLDSNGADGAYSSKDKNTTAAIDDKTSKLVITRGKTKSTVDVANFMAGIQELGIAGNLVVLKGRTTFSACDGDAQRQITGFAKLY